MPCRSGEWFTGRATEAKSVTSAKKIKMPCDMRGNTIPHGADFPAFADGSFTDGRACK